MTDHFRDSANRSLNGGIAAYLVKSLYQMKCLFKFSHLHSPCGAAAAEMTLAKTIGLD